MTKLSIYIDESLIACNRHYPGSFSNHMATKTEYLRSRLGMLLPEKYESIFDVSSEGPSSGSLVPTKGLRSKRRRYFHIFQVEAYLTYCEDI